MPHPNSLMYNVYPIFWPMKVFWFTRKSLTILFLKDFPTPPEGHPDNNISRGFGVNCTFYSMTSALVT